MRGQARSDSAVATRAGAHAGARRLGAVIAFAALIALGARIVLPLPGTPVPLTLQVPFVLLAGTLLGAWDGAAAVLLYLTLGVAGLPVFAAGGGPAYLLGPTGGYLVGFLPAAGLAGALAGRSGSFLRLLAAMTAGASIIYLCGAIHLGVLLGGGLQAALAAGVTPFLAVDGVKILGCAALVAAWRGRRPAAG